MTVNRLAAFIAVAALGVAALACKGTGKTTTVVTINSITLNPGTVGVGGTAQLTASISGADAGAIKSWSVTAGDLSTTQPDFAFQLRSTAKAASASSVSTSNSTVYWIAPSTPGDVTISLSVGGVSKSQTITVGSSIVSMDLTDGTGGKKVATIKVTGVTDLYQAAFRVNFTSAWKPEGIVYGDFLGAPADILTIGLTNQAGFVPVSITRKGNVAGKDGSGILATITFAPNSGTSSARELSNVPFDISLIKLVNSKNQEIANGN